MAIDGFRVELGAPAKGADIKDMVSKESVANLLEKARLDKDFEAAKGDYEFRLRKHKGQAVLELRRPTTGFFAKIWGGGRRSAERVAAYEAIARQVSSLAPHSGDMRKADARAAAGRIIGLEEFRRKADDGSLFRDIRPTDGAILRSLETVRENVLKDTFRVIGGIRVREGTMTLLSRADVSVDATGTLRIKFPGNGSAPENLNKVLDHWAAGASMDREDPEFRRMAENLLTCVGSDSRRLIGRLVEDHIRDDFGVTATDVPSSFELAFKIDGMKVDVGVSQTASLRRTENPAADEKAYSARLDFWWGMADEDGLAGRNFNERRAFDAKFVCGPEGAALDVNGG